MKEDFQMDNAGPGSVRASGDAHTGHANEGSRAGHGQSKPVKILLYLLHSSV